MKIECKKRIDDRNRALQFLKRGKLRLLEAIMTFLFRRKGRRKIGQKRIFAVENITMKPAPIAAFGQLGDVDFLDLRWNGSEQVLIERRVSKISHWPTSGATR